MALTAALAFGSKAGSSEPFGFKRAIPLLDTAGPPFGERVVKLPPSRILPSGWTTTARIWPLGFGSKPSRADCARAAETPQPNETAIGNSTSATFLTPQNDFKKR